MCPTLFTNYNPNFCCHCVFQLICFSLSSSLLTKTGFIIPLQQRGSNTCQHIMCWVAWFSKGKNDNLVLVCIGSFSSNSSLSSSTSAKGSVWFFELAIHYSGMCGSAKWRLVKKLKRLLQNQVTALQFFARLIKLVFLKALPLMKNFTDNSVKCHSQLEATQKCMME